MLIGIHKALNADILHTLASMGHGDTLVICDANFPAASVASQTVLGTHIEAGVDALTILEAVLSVFPVDTFDLEIPPVQGMQIVGAPDELPQIIKSAKPILKAANTDITLVERFAFYETAKQSYAIIRSSEELPYGNFILRKGVVL